MIILVHSYTKCAEISSSVEYVELDELLEESDIVTLHVPYITENYHMIGEKEFAKMKDGVKIINLSRADLVNVADIKEALKSGKVSCYVTDFPTEDTVNCEGIITTPHLGASTGESEDNCAVMAAHQLQDFLLNGNIKHSVNYPDIEMPRSPGSRLVVLHKNVPNMISTVTGKISAEGINIDHMANRSKGDYSVMLLDTPDEVSSDTIEAIEDINEIIRVIKV